MGLTILESDQDQPNHCSPARKGYRQEELGDIVPTTNKEQSPRQWSGQEDTEKIGLRTLGDGPLAPGAAGEAAQAEAEHEGDDDEVHPGTKGWLNLVGVSYDAGPSQAKP